MLNNATYDLMETATVLSKGLHRYATFASDSKRCSECQRVWEHMRRTDEEQLRMIVEHLTQHFATEVEVKIA
jgi:hypothetical protein